MTIRSRHASDLTGLRIQPMTYRAECDVFNPTPTGLWALLYQIIVVVVKCKNQIYDWTYCQARSEVN